ncbi:metallophosphoesterase [Pendulispora rubella]|uniref:Metallophosphoesterase n=1 Tax=Pendulispora rubella TaxID=2741070 RepID=A0ABZ2LAD6_9BACT
MHLLALSDLHVADRTNRDAIAQIADHKNDWLILAGDIGETEEHLAWTFETLGKKFARLLWVPGNHELWTTPKAPELRGELKYRRLIDVCRAFGVSSPEDPYPVWEGGSDGPCIIAPLFTLYDYSFRPDHVTRADALDWAKEHDLVCADEFLLDPYPYPTRDAWCAARCAATEERFTSIDSSLPTVLVNHFPLRAEHAWLPAIPRFSIWCGTRRTHDWHQRFRARVVVTGHLHVRTTRYLDGVRFEEVSLGYSRQWTQARGAESYLRTIF